MGKLIIREFYGDSEDAALWISQVEANSRLSNLSEESKLQHAIAHLRGKTELWLHRKGLQWDDWPTFTKALIARFCPADFYEQIEDAMCSSQHKVDESAKAYAERFFYLHKQTTDSKSINKWLKYWVRGLAGDNPYRVFAQNPSTFEETVDIAVRLEATESMLKASWPNDLPLLPTDQQPSLSVDELDDNLSRLATTHVTSRMSRTHQQPNHQTPSTAGYSPRPSRRLRWKEDNRSAWRSNTAHPQVPVQTLPQWDVPNLALTSKIMEYLSAEIVGRKVMSLTDVWLPIEKKEVHQGPQWRN